jgi:hypothetical protein
MGDSGLYVSTHARDRLARRTSRPHLSHTGNMTGKTCTYSAAEAEKEPAGRRGAPRSLPFSPAFSPCGCTYLPAYRVHVPPDAFKNEPGLLHLLTPTVHKQHAECTSGFLCNSGQALPLQIKSSAHEPPGPVSFHRIVFFGRDGKAGTHRRPGSNLPPEETSQHFAVESPP